LLLLLLLLLLPLFRIVLVPGWEASRCKDVLVLGGILEDTWYSDQMVSIFNG
jgi:hypothetical protein